MAPLPWERLKFMDEAGVNLAMTRLFGRAPKGQRVVDAVPHNYGQSVTMLAALGVDGVTAAMTINGASDGDVFGVFVEPVLGPSLTPGDIVAGALWAGDNLSAHKVAGSREAIESAGARLIYLPPYSPDLSPIEQCWSKLKSFLRTAQARTREALDEAITQAFATVSAADARAWFAHCGYALH